MVKIRSQGCTLYTNVRATELGKGRGARRVVRAMLTMSKQKSGSIPKQTLNPTPLPGPSWEDLMVQSRGNLGCNVPSFLGPSQVTT